MRPSTSRRAWCDEAVRRIEADYTRSADTHLLRVDVPGVPGCPLYLKDESVHPTGSLKHRLARSLFLYGLCNGLIGPRTTVVEASSGSTAVSEAYFARLIGVPFVAVMPRSTSREKIGLIEFHGGRCQLVDEPGAVYAEAAELARRTGGHYMDQFTYAERATDWRGNNNIAESIFAQMKDEPFPIPTWIVVGAGTGGTSATIGRYVRYQRHPTRICLADPENSVFHEYCCRRRCHADPDDRLAHRRHRSAARRAELQPARDRSVDPRSRRRLVCRGTLPRTGTGTSRRTLDRNRLVRLRGVDERDDAGRANGRRRDTHLRRWRALLGNLLRRPVARTQRHRLRHRHSKAGALLDHRRVAPSPTQFTPRIDDSQQGLKAEHLQNRISCA